MAIIDLWGGVECSCNRVGEQFFDQLSRNGHLNRISDLDLFASLGIKKLRYPVLWEQVAPQSLDRPDWLWPDERLQRLQELQIEPIVGLVHHGSGPAYTSLTSNNFAPLLAQYAGLVAERYPWVNYYTPVNEPLTTARFSGLYGLWYPHGTSDQDFVRALLNQLKGTRLAMLAIRQINPNAQLVQTEDLGETHSTHSLAYQAAFENERRWLSYDLLCGKVTPEHNLYKYLKKSGATTEELLEFVASPLPPDIFGINHYVTSERYLDEHLSLFPLHSHGSNGKHKYADVEAVRVKGVERAGVKSLLQEVWQRYQSPIAITEAHLCCTREEQMRWFMEVWEAATDLKKAGVNCLAVTAWALIGSYDWNSLLTRSNGFYESGIFDLRIGDKPWPTALVPMLQSLSSTGNYQHDVLKHKGWWDREERYAYYHGEKYIAKPTHKPILDKNQRPILITGATGTLGKAFGRICQDRGLSYVLLNRKQLDITNQASVEAAIMQHNPWAVINTAGYVRVDEAEKAPEVCYRENTAGAILLAEACKTAGIQFLTFSSDLVFDGEKDEPYTEEDIPNPRNVYGRSKALAEKEIFKILPESLIIRTSAFFSSWDRYNFVYFALKSFLQGLPFAAVNNVKITATYVPDLVHTSLNLLIDQANGIWHVTNQGSYTWAELARLVANVALLKNVEIKDQPISSFQLPAYRPKNSVLQSSKIRLMPTIEDALHRCIPALMQELLKHTKTLKPDLIDSEENLSRKLSG
ncbi:family 1 glycosylhydrolase [Adhaeribacter pallidiroseus]|uniref:dTDP-4-dehydrorhamnose reductase n=1 Tax=Adhaeribacter pallidiroseus TaxID=2072847 RepID=A0A369QK85_9BACT|nr:family 1 glycosylhydrolase [Adhaeribacter pallidiroseus]RDC64730.1 dTDP-4-dehydrorhamnose reductase [Adhaeribacter pallidiroseus]